VVSKLKSWQFICVDFSKTDREQSSANLVLMILMILNLNIVRKIQNFYY
jgi:hypothetical protein